MGILIPAGDAYHLSWHLIPLVKGKIKSQTCFIILIKYQLERISGLKKQQKQNCKNMVKIWLCCLNSLGEPRSWKGPPQTKPDSEIVLIPGSD